MGNNFEYLKKYIEHININTPDRGEDPEVINVPPKKRVIIDKTKQNNQHNDNPTEIQVPVQEQKETQLIEEQEQVLNNTSTEEPIIIQGNQDTKQSIKNNNNTQYNETLDQSSIEQEKNDTLIIEEQFTQANPDDFITGSNYNLLFDEYSILSEQNKQLKDKLQLAYKDIERFKQKAEESNDFEKALYSKNVIKTLLPAFDMLDNCIRYAKPTNDESEKIIEGFTQVQSQIQKSLNKLNIKVINEEQVIGQEVDPERTAVMSIINEKPDTIELPENANNIIIHIAETGYELEYDNNSMIIRPASVIVYKDPEQ